MAEEKNKPALKNSEAKVIAEVSVQPLDAQGFQKSISDELQNYMKLLKEAYTKGGKKSAELYQEYLKAQREQQMIFDESSKEDYRTYVGAMQQVWGQENAQLKMEDANRDYTTAVSERQMNLNTNLEELYRNYSETAQKQNEQVQQEYTGVYQDYLRSVQNAWQKVDVTKLDAGAIASAGHMLIAASGYAGQTVAINR